VSAPRTLAAALLFALAAPSLAAEPRLVDGELVRQAATDPAAVAAALGSNRPEWLGWSVPAVPDAGDICCHQRGFGVFRCSLGENRGWSDSRRATAPAGGTELLIFAKVERGAIRALQIAGTSCPVDAAGNRVLWLDGVVPTQSVAFLARALTDSDHDLPGVALGAVAYHATPEADRLLARVARDSGASSDTREAALFWAGNLRGDAGYDLLDQVLAAERDGSLREHAIFALTQSSAAEALPRIRRAAREDADVDVRSQALFWLGQSEDPRAAEWILDAIVADRDPEVREQGVFALSQLDDGVPQLARLLRETDDPAVRRQALFWLGQSDDPEALAALAGILGAD